MKIEPVTESNIRIDVIAIPCLGSEDYLLRQMQHLDLQSGGFKIFPAVLSSSIKVSRFGEPELNAVPADCRVEQRPSFAV